MKAAVALDWLMAGFMGLFVPVGPFVATAISRDPAYLREYRRTVLKGARHLRGQVRSRAFSRYVLYQRNRLFRHEGVVGACTHCGNCCMHKSCIFLDWSEQGESRCRIYNSGFWKKLACGRYPESGMDIALYQCPSFTAVPGVGEVPRRRVIPLVPVPTSPTEALQRRSMQ